MNAELPEDIKVFCIVRPTSRFNTKINADDREYSYYLPTFMLRSINEGWYGAGIQKAKRAEEQGKEEEKKPEGIKIMRKQKKGGDDEDGEGSDDPDY